MKIIDKVKWRINFLRSKLKAKKFSFYDFPSFLPSYVIEKHQRRLMNDILKNSNLFRVIEIKDKFLFVAEKFKFYYPKNLDYTEPIGQFIDFIYPVFNHDLYPYVEKKLLANKWLAREGSYEEGGVKIDNGDIVIDAGAFIGLFSIFAGKRVGKVGKVFAFEPDERSRGILSENIKLNNLENVEIFSYALGEFCTNLKFFVSSQHPASSGGIFLKGKEKIVPQITLDDFVKKYDIKRIDFIKADIEGMERNLLKGAEDVIKKFKPKIAICTYHLIEDEEILAGIIKSFVPQYKILKKNKKLYAWIEK